MRKGKRNQRHGRRHKNNDRIKIRYQRTCFSQDYAIFKSYKYITMCSLCILLHSVSCIFTSFMSLNMNIFALHQLDRQPSSGICEQHIIVTESCQNVNVIHLLLNIHKISIHYCFNSVIVPSLVKFSTYCCIAAC